VSVEGGYGFVASQSQEGGRTARVIVQPQVQAVGMLYRAHDHTEKAGGVADELNRHAFMLRLGVRVFADEVYDGALRREDGGGVRPFVEINWIHSAGRNRMGFNPGLGIGRLEVVDKLPSNSGEFKLGVQAGLGRNVTLWGYAAGQTTFSSQYNRVSVAVGLKYDW
jgi:outer membrane autotransporter protein